jgi:hypothetical protein
MLDCPGVSRAKKSPTAERQGWGVIVLRLATYQPTDQVEKKPARTIKVPRARFSTMAL